MKPPRMRSDKPFKAWLVQRNRKRREEAEEPVNTTPPPETTE